MDRKPKKAPQQKLAPIFDEIEDECFDPDAAQRHEAQEGLDLLDTGLSTDDFQGLD